MTTTAPISLTEATARTWDVIVIGTGMGGGTIGRRLAERGLSVLFVERGPIGVRAEEHDLNPDIWDREARLVRGYWPEPLEATVNGLSTTFNAPLGAGVGGSSVFYAAALERPAPHDLDHSAETPHPTGGWPVSYAEMAPYFDAAEAMYHVCGTDDPLGQPSQIPDGAPMSAADQALFDSMTSAGLHPYKGHLALKDSVRGADYLGRKCPHDYKMDGRSAGVEPALGTGKAALIDLCEVTEILHQGDGVTALRLRKAGEEAELSARGYVLSAGALHSPRVLMTSGDLGNQSGMVGRNLMFHLNEMFLLWPKRGAKSNGASKALAFRDLYHKSGERFGMVQAMGVEARYGEILHYLNMAFERSPLRHLRAVKPLLRLPTALATKLFGSAKLFVGILEDLPKVENRVVFDPKDPHRLAISYTMAPELLARRTAFRKVLRQSLKGLRMMFVGAGPELNFGHPCGTLRFGDDPQTSVLDRNCAVHGVPNLWVVDASFMPTSMGVNPSLTIAANALRVGDVIADSFEAEDRPDG
ncbi:GMC family oxidoreductase [Shimia sp. R9_2]|uniref:GMC oxidoreductase n=1 Tax=Shimia sp. R9_2 TaxID=2821112 RepID=UPI001AD99832|nr:GMC family oxidoreductase [Shimia sp. R9_2]MBO9397916.1 GMC family oxidoreductase [Shimia sp. R9_2]